MKLFVLLAGWVAVVAAGCAGVERGNNPTQQGPRLQDVGVTGIGGPGTSGAGRSGVGVDRQRTPGTGTLTNEVNSVEEQNQR